MEECFCVQISVRMEYFHQHSLELMKTMIRYGLKIFPDGNVMILTTGSFFISNFNGDSISLVSDTIISDVTDFQFKPNGEIIGVGMQTISGVYNAFTVLAQFDISG